MNNSNTNNNNNNNINKSNKKSKKKKTQRQQHRLSQQRVGGYPNTPDRRPVPPPHVTHPHATTYPVRHRGEHRPQCDYCFRPGHTAEVCYSRAAEERQEQRQERMLLKVLTEGLARQQPHHLQQPFHAPLHPSWQQQPGHHPTWNTPSWQGRH